MILIISWLIFSISFSLYRPNETGKKRREKKGLMAVRRWQVLIR